MRCNELANYCLERPETTEGPLQFVTNLLHGNFIKAYFLMVNIYNPRKHLCISINIFVDHRYHQVLQFSMNKNNTCKRAFKTAWFNKAAKKAEIKDADLNLAIRQVMEGQGTNLGGGVFKKRLNGNNHRSIILAKGECYWIYEYLFAKKDLDNIDDNELHDFRKLAKLYAELSVEQIERLVKNKSLIEIYYDK